MQKPRPLVVKNGPVTVPIYETVRGDGRVIYQVAIRTPGHRRLRQFRTKEKALVVAKKAASDLASGRIESATVSGDDKLIMTRCRDLLRPLGVSLTQAVEDYVAARRLLGDKAGIVAAAKDYASRAESTASSKLVADVVAEMIADRKTLGRSVRYLADLRSRLIPLGEAFKTKIAHVSTAGLKAWLDSRPGGPRTRNNYRAAIVALFAYARGCKYLPKGVATEAEELRKATAVGGEIGIFKPKEILSLLSASPEVLTKAQADRASFIGYVAMGAFAGLRHAELLRLDWKDVDLAGGYPS